MELALLTPIARLGDRKLSHANRLAIQVLGGAGYTMTTLSNGSIETINSTPLSKAQPNQAMDLLGQVTMMAAAMQHLVGQMQDTLRRAGRRRFGPPLPGLATNHRKGLRHHHGVDGFCDDRRSRCLANATPYMFLLGHTVVEAKAEQGLCWNKNSENPTVRLSGQRKLFGISINVTPTYRAMAPLNPIDTTCLDTRPEWF